MHCSDMRTFRWAYVLFILRNGLCAPECVKAETAGLRPMPGKQVSEKVDRLMRSLQTLKDEERKQAISDLYDIMTAKEPGVGDAISYFGYSVTQNADGTRTMSAKPDRNAVLSKVIPILISEIEPPETKDNKAYMILIFLQGDCPPPQREVWEDWWKLHGSKKFAPTLGR
jgi:hypothetical protein